MRWAILCNAKLRSRGGKASHVPELVLASSLAPGQARQDRAAVQPWADVIDDIGMTLAASRDAATRPGEAAKARRLADDAYWVGFESTDMETAVNKYLGFGQSRKLERQFHAISMAAREVADKRQPVSVMAELCHQIAAGSHVGRDGAQRPGSDRPIADRRARRPGREPVRDGEPPRWILPAQQGQPAMSARCWRR